MELLQLRYFRELARSEHLSKVAEKLHISQPSLSQMLKRLEKEIGMPLFDRVGKRIVLNESGKIFLRYVDEVFDALDNASLELEVRQKQKKQTVALYVFSASMHLPEIVSQVQKAAPNVRLQIYQHIPEEKPSCPFLCLTSVPVCPKQDACFEILLEERIKAALPATHPLAERPELTWEDLKDESFLSLVPGSDLSRAVQYFCSEKGIQPDITTWVDSPDVLRRFLRLNLGIAFIPEDTWRGFAEDTVVLKPVEDLQMKRYLLLSWEEAMYQTPAWKLCKTIITDYFREKRSIFTEYSLPRQ